VGEYQNGIFFEASRIMKLKNPKDVIQLHVTYIPYWQILGNLKVNRPDKCKNPKWYGYSTGCNGCKTERKIDKRRWKDWPCFVICIPKQFSPPQI